MVQKNEEVLPVGWKTFAWNKRARWSVLIALKPSISLSTSVLEIKNILKTARSVASLSSFASGLKMERLRRSKDTRPTDDPRIEDQRWTIEAARCTPPAAIHDFQPATTRVQQRMVPTSV